MATVYSLLCFAGRTGKTVTLTIASPCVVSLADHGLRDGMGVVLSTTGALPTGVTAGAVYYAKSTAAGTFNLYDTESHAIAGGATGIVNTSGIQSGTHNVKGAYWYGLTTEQKARYGDAGAERAYDGFNAFMSARGSLSLPYDTEIVEIYEPYTDKVTAQILNISRAETIIAPEVDGVKTPAWHGGAYGAGYRLNSSASYGIGLDITGYRHTFRDISIISAANGTVLIRTMGMFNSIDNCFIIGTYGQQQTGYKSSGAANTFRNNTLTYWWKGVLPETYATIGNTVANNLVAKGETGFVGGGGSTIAGFFYNNISVGNTTANWTAQTGVSAAINNYGVSGDAPWYKTTDTGIKTITADNSTFADYANNDFRPASASAPQVDTGVVVLGMAAKDLAGDDRPNYNNGGAEAWDGGPFEFDHGFVRPASHVLTLTNVVTGSRVHVSDQAGTVVHYDDIAASSTVVITQTVYGDSRDDWRIRVRKASDSPAYQPYETLMTATAGSSSLYIAQIQDE